MPLVPSTAFSNADRIVAVYTSDTLIVYLGVYEVSFKLTLDIFLIVHKENVPVSDRWSSE